MNFKIMLQTVQDARRSRQRPRRDDVCGAHAFHALITGSRGTLYGGESRTSGMWRKERSTSVGLATGRFRK